MDLPLPDSPTFEVNNEHSEKQEGWQEKIVWQLRSLGTVTYSNSEGRTSENVMLSWFETADRMQCPLPKARDGLDQRAVSWLAKVYLVFACL